MLRVAALAALLHATGSEAGPSPNLPCKPLGSYMPPDMSKNYDMNKHNGTWYEVAFRDLYPWGPLCYCQQSIKYVNKEKGFIDDYFVFSCGPGKLTKTLLNYISPQRENVTNGGTGERHQNGIYDMYVRSSDFDFITHFEWNSEMIGWKDDGKDQYKWVIEWQCGTRPGLPKWICPLGHASDGNCYFTGVQMFVRDFEFMAEGRKEMIEYLKSLNGTGSEAASWVMDDFSGGTFPPFFEHNSWDDRCGLPCKTGCFNETTQMWGCCMDQPHLTIANPLGDETLDALGAVCEIPGGCNGQEEVVV